jgi:hypothetical protein
MMRINNNIARNLLGEYDLSGCPSMFSQQARNILWIVEQTPYEGYNTVTELDKWVTARYWIDFDGYARYVNGGRMTFGDWYIHKASNPEIISRALRWLRQNGYIIIKDEVQKDAERKASMVRGQMR